MAEGVTHQRSSKDPLTKASGDADELFCDSCKHEGAWIAVEGYCQICEEYMCETCLGVHRKQSITRAHAILDKKQMPIRQGSEGKKDLCIEVCKTHHPEIVRFYCTGHDETGCGDCMTLKHTSCKKDRVQDISDGFQKTKEFKDVDQALQQPHKELEKMEAARDNNMMNLDTTYNNILRKITSVRKQINEYLDHIQKKISDEAAQMKKEDEAALNILHAETQETKAEIEVLLRTIHDSNVNVHSLFVVTKQAKQGLVKIEKEINEIKQSQQQQYEFLISNEIEKIISVKTPLGKLSRQSQQKVKTMTEKRGHMTSRTPTIDVTATYNSRICVKGEADKKTCWISDCTLLSPERMVVTDCHNKDIKLIDISNKKVISCYSTSSALCRLNTLSTNMIAVTLSYEGKIQLLDVNSALTLHRDIKVNKVCYGIAYKEGKLAVNYVTPGRVEILDIQGKVLHTIQPTQGKICVLQQPVYIIFGQDNDTVIVSDCKTHKVSVVTFRGQILRTYTHDTLKSPRGIVIAADGVLFVCSSGSGCIHVVSPDFKTSKIIINDTNVVSPYGIVYCDINNRLYISNDDISEGDYNNYIQVYDLNV